jgi:hypothetical protein
VIKDIKALYLPLGTFVVSMLVWYVCSVELGWGEAEAEHDPASVWSYFRRGWMIALAVGLPLLSRQGGFKSYGWRVTLPWLLVAVVIGLVQGMTNRGGFEMSVIAVLGSAYHSFAVEIYFRAYMIQAFSRAFNGFWPPILLSSLMYGLFYLSVYPAMQENPFVFYVPFFTVLGIVFGFIYAKSKSFLITWWCHWAAVLPVIPALFAA